MPLIRPVVRPLVRPVCAPFISTLGGIQPEAKLLFDAMSTPPTQAFRLIANPAILNAKNLGVWQLSDGIWFCAAETQQAANLNWINPATFTLSPQASPGWTTHGYTTNGTSSYVDTTFNISSSGVNQTQNSVCWQNYVRTAAQQTSRFSGEWDGTDGLNITGRNATNDFLFRINQTNASSTVAGADAGTITDGSGLWAVNRSASNALQCYRNGVSKVVGTNPTQASTARNNLTMKLLTADATLFGINGTEIAFASISASLTAAQISGFYSNTVLPILTFLGAN